MALQEVQLRISGMTCAHCERTVTHAITELDGIERADVNHHNGMATVRFDNAKVSIEQIRAAVAETEVYKVEEVILP